MYKRRNIYGIDREGIQVRKERAFRNIGVQRERP
jgi:hypothetical protein